MIFCPPLLILKHKLNHVITSRKQSGFTLVELSIVIVIIGLIVAGVTAGKSLVSAANLRTIVGEINETTLAINAFKLQYNYLPGDLPNAYSYWGASCDASAALCNGNGDSMVPWQQESMRSWQHLALAKLVTGTYTGLWTGTITPDEFFISKSKLASFAIQTVTDIQAFKSGGTASRNNFSIFISAPSGSDGWIPPLTVGQTQNIDNKIDDGVANNGKVYGISGNGVASSACSAYGSVVGGAGYIGSKIQDNP